jgi:hypothetical protein
MAITRETNDYVIPRGVVYFDPFDSSGDTTGERELGNAPSFTIEMTSEKADHYNSQAGLREKDQSVTVQIDRTATLTVDNISLDNLSLFLAGSTSTITQSAASGETDTITVQQGRHYQIGVSALRPTGVRAITLTSVVGPAPGSIAYDADDYEVDLDLGRIRIKTTAEGGSIPDDTELTITYATTAVTWSRANTGSTAEVDGAMRVISANASGTNRDYYMPSVRLTPSGNLPVITDATEYVSMEFSVEVLKPANAEAIYLDGRAVA